ncbi:PIN domain-containing protein [Pseudaeromonas paramecii]|uniref:PIN-like domain-containing protein n=1 Tax=Pseudaeromonas paramecii TaxID=2138166 RepID=A0ABP8QEB7_9GAMM
MANRILIITNDNIQDLPLNEMARFNQVTLLIGKGQTNLSLEMARCLLELQSRQSIHIDLQPVKHTSKTAFDMHFALQLGRMLEREPDSSFTILSNDAGYDPLVANCREQGLKVNRVEELRRAGSNQADSEPVASKEPEKAEKAEKNGKEKDKSPELELEATSKGVSRNQQLISSLIGKR